MPVTSKPQKKRALWTAMGASLVVLADQASKWWAELTLSHNQYVPLISDLIGWRLIYNPGAAFGLGANSTWILTIIAAIAVLVLAFFTLRAKNRLWAFGTACLLGGAVSHLGDRLFRSPGFAQGHIVDFIDYGGFFVGNIADIFLVGGAVFMILVSWFERETPDSKDGPLRRAR